MKILENSKIVRHPSYEPFGYVFTYEDDLYRGIYPSHEKHVRQLFQCGLIDELTKNKLFPKSELTDFHTEDCSLVIYHEKVDVVTLPFEWSFSMLKDAALVTLKANIVARQYGYETKDSHGFNVLFQFGQPMFIDLGSFVKIENEFGSPKLGWRAYGEFMRSFYAPLQLWSHDESYLARHALHGDQIPMKTYWRHRNPLLRFIPVKGLERWEFLYYKYKGLNTRSIEEFLQFASRNEMLERLSKLILWLAQKRLLLFSSVDLERNVRKVQKIQPPRTSSKWGRYQASMEVSSRHLHIVSLIEQLKVKTVLDLGGNAGFISRLILDKTDVDYVVSADYDENAIDYLYRSLQENPAKIYPALLNFGISITDTKYKVANERLKSEAVLVLALTHHLILSQGMSLEFVLERISSFSSKYVFVEFMPQGCYSSKKEAVPKVPDWYNVEWFRSKFQEYFVPVVEKQIELNRILFVGKLR